MFKTGQQAVAMVEELKPLVAGVETVDIVICPPFTALSALQLAVKGTNIRLGAQNMHWAKEGAFTGEISADMLKELGCEYVILGHSERRQYFAEIDETVNNRLKAAVDNGLKPILCVGELLEQREEGKTEAVVEKQVKGGLKGFTEGELKDLVIAYEPVWAIGTGKTASKEDAQEVIAFIRKTLGGLFSEGFAQGVRIQYGGSVKPENIKELMAQEDIDGALVGGASLEAKSFAALVKF